MEYKKENDLKEIIIEYLDEMCQTFDYLVKKIIHIDFDKNKSYYNLILDRPKAKYIFQ